MIVITGDYGQLGNRLIVFANMIAAAREHGLRVADPAFHEYAEYFEATRRDLLCRYPLVRSWLPGGRRLRHAVHRGANGAQRYARNLHNRTGRWPGVRVLDIGWHARCDLDGPEFLELARQPGLLLAKGWLFRARQSFTHHADEIRRFFTPAASHRARVAACLAALRRSAEVVVGVHVRHGDYRHFLGGRFFFEAGQYAALLRRMRELLGGRETAFLICSNAAQPTDAFAGLNATPGPGRQIEDLYALAACDYLIGPPSTYTMWASFYGQTPLYVVTDPAVAFELSDFEVFRTLERTPREFLAAEKGRACEGTGVR
jgi:hypothetical protein